MGTSAKFSHVLCQRKRGVPFWTKWQVLLKTNSIESVISGKSKWYWNCHSIHFTILLDVLDWPGTSVLCSNQQCSECLLLHLGFFLFFRFYHFKCTFFVQPAVTYDQPKAYYQPAPTAATAYTAAEAHYQTGNIKNMASLVFGSIKFSVPWGKQSCSSLHSTSQNLARHSLTCVEPSPKLGWDLKIRYY